MSDRLSYPVRTERGPAGNGARMLMRLAAYAATGLAVALVAYLIGFGFFASHVSSLKPPEQAGSADGIIVLTGGRERISTAFDLLREGRGQPGDLHSALALPPLSQVSHCVPLRKACRWPRPACR